MLLLILSKFNQFNQFQIYLILGARFRDDLLLKFWWFKQFFKVRLPHEEASEIKNINFDESYSFWLKDCISPVKNMGV